MMQEVEIPKRETFRSHLTIDAPQKTITFGFSTRKNTIGFGLYFLVSSYPGGTLNAMYQDLKIKIEATTLAVEYSSKKSRIEQWLRLFGPAKTEPSGKSVYGRSRSRTFSPKEKSEEEGRPRSNSRSKRSSVYSRTTDEVGSFDDDMIEILPLQRYESDKFTVKGSYTAVFAGVYVLLFDNSFSINTSKRLTFFATLGQVDSLQPKVEMSGWLMKKKKKRMQGWAKRWFQINNGLLSYYEHPNSYCRGTVEIQTSTVTSNPDKKMITIDSGLSLYHLRAINLQDFISWCDALRSSAAATVEEVQSNFISDLAILINKIDKHFACTEEDVLAIKKNCTQEIMIKVDGELNEIANVTKEIEDLVNGYIFKVNSRRVELENVVSDSLVEKDYASDDEVFYDAEELSSNHENDEKNEEEEEEIDSNAKPKPFERRKFLPSKITGEQVSFTSILRRNIGKDLSTVSMPISMNEPLSLLQKMCEETCEYVNLLFRAATEQDSINRLALVTAYVVSGYACNFYRTSRKPFNPLLGETYECDRPDQRYRFIAEKVSHHPVILACHLESFLFKLDQTLIPKTKFWGKSIELSNMGLLHLKFTNFNDHFVWEKVSSCITNIITGPRKIQVAGKTEIRNQTTNEYSVLEFEDSGYFSSSNNAIKAAIYDSNNVKKMVLVGTWNDAVYRQDEGNKLELLWKVNPMPAFFEEYYGFTQFAVELNEVTRFEKILPVTDSRLRTDQRLFECGDWRLAEVEKQRLEDNQRKTRKKRQEMGQEWSPKWFEKKNGNEFVFNEKYWRAKDCGNFGDDQDNIFDQ